MTAFRPIPEYVLPTVGLWGKDSAWQSWDLREKGAKLIETARRQRLFSCCCAWRSLPKFEERFPNDMRPRECIQTAELFYEGIATIQEMEVKLAAAREAAAWAWAAAREAAAAWATAAAEAAAAAAAAAEAAAAREAAAWAAWAAASAAEAAAKAAAWAAAEAEAAAAAAAAAEERLNQSRIYTLFLPMPLPESCRTPTTIAMADQFYAGDATVGPILADVLEESGFDRPDYWLRLLREDAWVLSKGNVLIDAIIGKPGAVKAVPREQYAGITE